MSAFADPQTLSDLNIPGRHRVKSIAWLFDTVLTGGGRTLMESMFRHPLTDADEINQRSAIFRYFAGQSLALPVGAEEFELVETYLTSGGSNLLGAGLGVISLRIAQVAVNDPDYAQLQRAVRKTVEVLGRFAVFLNELPDAGGPCAAPIENARHTLVHPALAALEGRGIET